MYIYIYIYYFFLFFVCEPDRWRDLDDETPSPAAQVPNPQPRRLRSAHKASPPAARNAVTRPAGQVTIWKPMRPPDATPTGYSDPTSVRPT